MWCATPCERKCFLLPTTHRANMMCMKSSGRVRVHEFGGGGSHAHWRLVAEQLHLVARVVAVQPDADARGRVAVAAGVDQTHVGHGAVVGDGVDALAVVAVGTVAGARGAWRQLRVRPHIRVADDLGVLALYPECGRDIIFSSVSLG